MSYDLDVAPASGKPSQWRRYLRKQGYHSIIKSREHQFETFGKGDVEVTVWELFGKGDVEATVWNTDVKYPVQFSIGLGGDENHHMLQQQSAQEFARQFQGKVYDPQTDEFLRDSNKHKKQQSTSHKESQYCGPGKVWVPGFHKHDGTYVKGFCRKKAH